MNLFKLKCDSETPIFALFICMFSFFYFIFVTK